MFEFENLVIRNVEDSDLEHIRRLRNDPSTWMMLSEPGMIDAESQKEWFHRTSGMRDRKYYVLADADHAFIGIVRTDEIDYINRSIRIGADIHPDLRGKGIGQRTYRLLKKFCFDEMNMHRIWLAVLDCNERALKLYEQQGFSIEGTYREAVYRDGQYHDYIIMSILEHEYRTRM